MKEIKDVLDFNFMLEHEEDIKSNTETYEGCVAKVKSYGNESLKKIIKRQDSENSPSEAGISKFEKQYHQFKKFAFDLVVNVDMTKERKYIKAASISETAACHECHRRFEIQDLVKHVRSAHKNLESVKCQDKIKNSVQLKFYRVCAKRKSTL